MKLRISDLEKIFTQAKRNQAQGKWVTDSIYFLDRGDKIEVEQASASSDANNEHICLISLLSD